MADTSPSLSPSPSPSPRTRASEEHIIGVNDPHQGADEAPPPVPVPLRMELTLQANMVEQKPHCSIDHKNNERQRLAGIAVVSYVLSWATALMRGGRERSVKRGSESEISSVKLSGKVVLGDGIVWAMNEASPEEFCKGSNQSPFCRNILYSPQIPEIQAALKQFEQIGHPSKVKNEEVREFPFQFATVVVPIAGWGAANIMSADATELFKDFPYKWMRPASLLMEFSGIIFVFLAWLAHKKRPFFSYCSWGISLALIFAGAVLYAAPILRELQ